MRVLFLPKYPLNGASSRYRVHQFLDYFKDHGVLCDVSSFYTPEQFEMSKVEGRTVVKSAYLFGSALRRLAAILRATRYDLVYMHRECLPLGPPLAEQLLEALNVRTVFDYDDALFLFRANRHARAWNALKNPDRIGRIMRHVDCVVAANEFLASYARTYCSTVVVVEEAEDTDRIRPLPAPRRDGRKFTIGWIGSPSTEHYLEALKPVLRRLSNAPPEMRMIVVGGGKFQMEGLEIVHEPWSLADEAELLNRFDIGVMPLPDNDWSRGKAGCKARMYMSVGIPAVASAIGYSCQLIEDGKTGVLVNTEDEWMEAIRRLAADPALRSSIGEAARRHVEENFSIERIGSQLLQVMHNVARS